MIAGLTLADTLASAPGMVMDLYVQRRDYDDQLHGITRRAAEEWSD